MSLDFVRDKLGSSELAIAVKQQEQLNYFTRSSVQKDIADSYYEQWAERKFNTNDDFLNFVKSVFKTDNFMSFFKYFRNPLPSAELINERVKVPLSRVFYSEDSYFKYTIKNKVLDTVEELDSLNFDETIFNTLLFGYNNILVTGLKDINTPFREVISIDNIVSIESKNSVISRIAYSAEFQVEDKTEKGWLYMDDKDYIFYYNGGENNIIVHHDLQMCPADYIAKGSYGKTDIVRESMFTFVRAKFEEYVFLKTLQRMTEPNGAIPVVTKLDTKIANSGGDIKGESDKEPMSSNLIGGQAAEYYSEVNGKGSILQTGSIINVPIIRKEDGSIDMDAVTNFLNFFYIPTEALNYLRERINEIEQSLIVSLLGDFSEGNDSAKNELQISKSFVSKQDKLRVFSLEMSRIRNLSDYKFLALKYGKDNVTVDCFYGSDFFLESQDDLFNLFKESPNAIERKDLLVKISRNKNRFNKLKMEREILLYDLLPYCSDIDFDKAITRGLDSTTFEYQTRFNYWIGIFEAKYGNIVMFWKEIEGDNSEKLVLINKLILNIINEENDLKTTTKQIVTN